MPRVINIAGPISPRIVQLWQPQRARVLTDPLPSIPPADAIPEQPNSQPDQQ